MHLGYAFLYEVHKQPTVMIRNLNYERHTVYLAVRILETWVR